jgi:hypothetical protein
MSTAPTLLGVVVGDRSRSFRNTGPPERRRCGREWNGREPFARCLLPILLIRAHLGEDPDALRLREIKPNLEVGITVGAGPFHQLEVPEQVNAMIERFLEQAA